MQKSFRLKKRRERFITELLANACRVESDRDCTESSTTRSFEIDRQKKLTMKKLKKKKVPEEFAWHRIIAFVVPLFHVRNAQAIECQRQKRTK